jgi:hypothetical protein
VIWLLLLVVACLGAAHPASVFAQSSGPTQSETFVTQTIRYRMDQASDVTLCWGINGWTPLPADQIAKGTVLRNRLMYTPMQRAGDMFEARIRVPKGTIVDYAFQITRTLDGAIVDVWDANGNPKQDYHTYAVEGGYVELHAPDFVIQQVAPDAVSAPTLWYVLSGLAGIGLIVGVWLLQRRLRNPYMNF